MKNSELLWVLFWEKHNPPIYKLSVINSGSKTERMIRNIIMKYIKEKIVFPDED